jgi:hypothetical protein
MIWSGFMTTIGAWRSGFFAITVAAFALLSDASSAQAEMVRGPACSFPDLTDVAAVSLQQGAGDPAGSADPIPGGRWELTSLRYRTSPLPIPITGEATGVIELAAASPSAGEFSAALEVDISAPVEQVSSEAGAGLYEQTDGLLDFTNQCGEALTLSAGVYRVDSTGPQPILTLWGQSDIAIPNPPITVTIELEAAFTLVEPQGAGDPVFDDRFELP